VTAAAEQPGPTQRPTSGQDSTRTPSDERTDPVRIDHTMRVAASVAIEALEERAGLSRLLLTDRTLYGLTDPQTVQRSVARDQQAAQVLRAALQPLLT
jgi:hypothetical protein